MWRQRYTGLKSTWKTKQFYNVVVFRERKGGKLSILYGKMKNNKWGIHCLLQIWCKKIVYQVLCRQVFFGVVGALGRTLVINFAGKRVWLRSNNLKRQSNKFLFDIVLKADNISLLFYFLDKNFKPVKSFSTFEISMHTYFLYQLI